MLGRAHPIRHGDVRVIQVVVSPIEGVLKVQVGLVVYDVATAGRDRPIIIAEIDNGRAGIRIEVNVTRRGVGLIEHIGNIRLQVKACNRVPVNRFADNMLCDIPGLRFTSRYGVTGSLRIDGRGRKVISVHQ